MHGDVQQDLLADPRSQCDDPCTHDPGGPCKRVRTGGWGSDSRACGLLIGKLILKLILLILREIGWRGRVCDPQFGSIGGISEAHTTRVIRRLLDCPDSGILNAEVVAGISIWRQRRRFLWSCA